ESWLLTNRVPALPTLSTLFEIRPAIEVGLKTSPNVALIAIAVLVLGTSATQTWLALSAVSVIGDCTAPPLCNCVWKLDETEQETTPILGAARLMLVKFATTRTL